MTPVEFKKDLWMFKSGKILIMDVQEKLQRSLIKKRFNSSFEDLNSNCLLGYILSSIGLYKFILIKS